MPRTPSGTQVLTSFRISLGFVSILSLFSLSCRDKAIDSATVRQAFFGTRLTQPRLSGMPFGACTSTEDLVPVATCRSPAPELASEKERLLSNIISRALSSSPNTDQLQAAALFSIATDPHDEGSLLSASGYLREAADQEKNSHRLASLRSDLSATHLLLAEKLQSPLEVAAALEQALWALEENPYLPEAQFNSMLSLVLLGMDQPQNSPLDRWENELRSRLFASPTFSSRSSPPPSRTPTILGAFASYFQKIKPSPSSFTCPTQDEIKEDLDKWSLSAKNQYRLPFACNSDPDRLLNDTLRMAQAEPARVGSAWREFRGLNSCLYSLKIDLCQVELDSFLEKDPPFPLKLEAEWIQATIAYLGNQYGHSLAILERLAAEAGNNSYFELQARSLRTASLIWQIRGDYTKGIELLDQALRAADQSGYEPIRAAVLSLLVEQQGLVGREEEAWSSAAIAMRKLDMRLQVVPRINCLQTIAQLALQRGMKRVAAKAHEIAIGLARKQSPALLCSALRSRGEMYAEQGLLGKARLDLARAQQLLASAAADPDVVATINSDLKHLEGRIAEDLGIRKKAAQEALNSFEHSDYGRRQVSARYALAQVQIELGEIPQAISTLRQAMVDLSSLTSKLTWIDASALVEAARPVADELIGLELQYASKEEVLKTIGRYLSLRSGSEASAFSVPDGQRLVYFVRNHEVIIIVQKFSDVILYRSKVEKERLEDLRETLLIKLQSGSPRGRLEESSSRLARELIVPAASSLTRGQPLAIVPDDVIAGIPFALLPFEAGGSLMANEFTLSYSTDLRPMPLLHLGQRAVIVGSTATEGNQDALAAIGKEVDGIRSFYSSPAILVGDQATASRVRGELKGSFSIGHFAAHFVVNPRVPLQSYFVLAPTPNDSGRLTLQDLLAKSHQQRFELLYLSGCDTGRGLPASARGFRALAQIFSSAKITWTVLSHLPLPDEAGSRMAILFHRGISVGLAPPEALCAAQTQVRSEFPHAWAPLAVYY